MYERSCLFLTQPLLAVQNLRKKLTISATKPLQKRFRDVI